MRKRLALMSKEDIGCYSLDSQSKMCGFKGEEVMSCGRLVNTKGPSTGAQREPQRPYVAFRGD